MKKLCEKVCLVLVLGGFSLNAVEKGHEYITAIHADYGGVMRPVIVAYKHLHGTEGSGSHPLLGGVVLGGVASTLLTGSLGTPQTTTLSLENPIDLGQSEWQSQMSPTFVSILLGDKGQTVQTFDLDQILQFDPSNKSGKWMVNIDRQNRVSFKAAS